MTTAISVQVDKKDKEEATLILQRLGVTMSALINMTLKQVIIKRGIPFEVRESNISNDMIEALNELEYLEKHIDEYKKSNKWNDLRKELLNDK